MHRLPQLVSAGRMAGPPLSISLLLQSELSELSPTNALSTRLEHAPATSLGVAVLTGAASSTVLGEHAPPSTAELVPVLDPRWYRPSSLMPRYRARARAPGVPSSPPPPPSHQPSVLLSLLASASPTCQVGLYLHNLRPLSVIYHGYGVEIWPFV